MEIRDGSREALAWSILMFSVFINFMFLIYWIKTIQLRADFRALETVCKANDLKTMVPK